MNKIKSAAKVLLFWLKTTFFYFLLSIRKKRFLRFLLSYLSCLLQHLYAFSKEIEEIKNPMGMKEKQKIKLKKLKNLTAGLHQLLPATENYFYSFLVCIEETNAQHLEHTLNSLLDLSAPNYEILLGIAKEQNSQIQDMLDCYINKNTHRLKIYNFEIENLNRSAILNKLANKIKGNYLFIINPGESVRTDLLYRYEQTLRFYDQKQQERTVLYCNENILDDQFVPKASISKPEKPNFPYYFQDFLGNTLLIPKTLWIAIGGSREEFDSVQAFDLPLRLANAGAEFVKIPVTLFSSLKKHKQRFETSSSEERFYKLMEESYKNYFQNNSLNWCLEPGYISQSPRIVPNIKDIPKVHVVIPFKDQENMTLNTVDSVLKQEGVDVRITAVDNNSTNLNIAEKLKNLGVEVIHVSEPYNYSRINNIAIYNSNISDDYNNILLLNNDVELESGALLEMCRWIDQPNIGIVGCKLNYPNGLLQHGGVELNSLAPSSHKAWHHPEQGLASKDLTASNCIRIVPAVTAACCLIKKDIYRKIGGFDEIWYPVTFSDTSLAAKIKSLALLCLYTPFAVGVHHESISRSKDNIEDYEFNDWVYKQFSKQILKNKNISFEDLESISY